MSERRRLHSDNFDYCRLCIIKPEEHRLLRFFDIFPTSKHLEELSEDIQDFFHIEITKEDDLPKIICERCYESLMNSKKNMKMAIDAQLVLNFLKKQPIAPTTAIDHSPYTNGTNVLINDMNCAPSTSHDLIIHPSKKSTITKTIIRKTTTETTIIRSSSNFPSSAGKSTIQSTGQMYVSDEEDVKDEGNYYRSNQIITTCLVPNCYVVSREKKDILSHYRRHMISFSRAKLCNECSLSHERNMSGVCKNRSCASYKSVIFKTLKCFECNILFETMLELTTHKINTHICILKTSSEKYECLQCKIACEDFMLIETHLMFCIKRQIGNFNFTTYN